MVVGNKTAQVKVKSKLKEQPLILCKAPMKCVESEKYLGDQISASGLADSVLDTVNLRAGKVTTSIYEIKAILEDCRIHSVGGIVAGLELWEAAVIPKLMYNSDVWTDINKVTVDKLEKLQNEFLRALLSTPKSTPTPSLCWETGTCTMENRILQNKLLFYHHLLNLGEDALAHQVAIIQQKYGYPGLISECVKIADKLNLPDITNGQYSKLQWKRLVKEKIQQKNKDDFLNSIKGSYKKLDFKSLSEEKFEIKSYFKELGMHDARLYFRSRCKMLKSVKMNFKNHPPYLKDQWKCSGCSMVDSQEHLLWCPGYATIREGKDLSNNGDLVGYYREILRLRDE